ncbi:transposase [mine drainage metagenome]|uniref:Transposase n=3 Tax=mine drainage metagenome TaxID=410659 RepID=T0YD13_9ZZZZ
MEGGVWMEGNLTMSRKEVDRVGVMQQVAERRILQQEAAARLGISVRQVKRLRTRLRGEGPQGLVSRRRGWRPNNAFPQDLRQEILALVRSQGQVQSLL